jgi:hypothetical protein
VELDARSFWIGFAVAYITSGSIVAVIILIDLYTQVRAEKKMHKELTDKGVGAFFQDSDDDAA